MDKKSKAYLLSVLASALIVLPLYIVVHEFGHTLVALLCGAKITQFSVINARMSYEGGIFTRFTSSLLNASGMLLPVLLAVIYMLLYRRKIEGTFNRVFSFFFSLMPAFSILAWVIVPIIDLAGSAPAGDDVTQFLANSALPPLGVTLAALLLLAASVALAGKKGIIANFQVTIKSMRAIHTPQ